MRTNTFFEVLLRYNNKKVVSTYNLWFVYKIDSGYKLLLT